MSKELNKAPVEQAGGDERDLQGAQGERDGWGPFPIVQVPWNVFDRAVMWVEDRRRYGDDGTIVDDWKALKTIQRAALAKPSPDHAVQAHDIPMLIASEHANPDYAMGWNDCRANLIGTPSPAQAEQAEAERPEVVARVVHSNPVVLDQCAPLNANDELMTVAQHAASVARWAEMFNRVEQERDAALSRVAELEKQEPVAHLRASDLERLNQPGIAGSAGSLWNGPREGFVPLYAAPVAQAQHSVPDDDMILQIFADNAEHSEQGDEHGYCIVREQHAQAIARKLLAAAPVFRLSRSALTDAQMRRLYDSSTETENERLGFAAFARLIRRAEAVHQIAAAPGKEGV